MFRLALGACLLASLPAVAQEDDPETSDEITVWGHPIQGARLEVVEALEAEGYTLRRTRRGKDVFAAPQTYKPKLVIDRDGHVVTRRRNLVWVGADGRDDGRKLRAEDLFCLVQPQACLSTKGAWISQKKLKGEVREVLDAVAPQLANWRQVLQDEHHAARMAHELPHELDRLWRHGVAPDGTVFEDPLARRAAIVDLWLSRVDDPYGDDARAVIERYLVQHVQDTEWALTPAEIAAIDARYEGSRTFALAGPEPPPVAVEPEPSPPVEPVAAEVAPVAPKPAALVLPPLAPVTPTRSLLFDVPPLGEPTQRGPLEWLRGTEQDAIEATAHQPDHDPDAAPGLED